MTDFRGVLKEPKNINFIVSIVISIALDTVILSDCIMKRDLSGGFGDLQVYSIKIENGKKSTLETK